MGPQRFFFYGTLLADARTPMAEWLAARVVESQPASTRGRLVAIPSRGGWYPALLPGGAGRVAGSLCTLRIGPAALARLDRYEGPQYRRAELNARGAAGHPLRAAAYIWRASLPSGARSIPKGDFLDWLERTGARAFT